MSDEPVSLRVALVGPASPWRGGIAQHVDATAATLRARGHAVRVLSFTRQYPTRLFPGRTQLEPGRGPVEGTSLRLDSLNPLSWRSAGRWLADWSPDLVLPSYWLPFFVPAFAGVCRGLRRGATRVVFDCHNVLPHERRLVDGVLTRWMVRIPDAFIVHAEAVRGTLIALRPEAHVVVTPLPLAHDFPDGPGRDAARARLGLDPASAVLLFFGFVRRYKGLDVALEALEHLPETTRLLVVGEHYEDPAPYRRLAERSGERVKFVPSFVPRDEVGVYFDACDLVVLPYRRATQSGVVPLAMRFRRPVVSTRVGGLAEHVREGENGFLVAPEDPDALAVAIERALDPSHRARLAEGVEAARLRLSWDRLAEVIESLA
jgi:glycosyltransferase involved in cell wall biosynthesis